MEITFRDFLMWLQHPGIEAAVGILTSVVAQYVSWFESLDRKWKLPVMLVFNVGVPVLAAAVGVALNYQPLDFDATFWPAIVAGVIAFAGSQGTWMRREVAKMKAYIRGINGLPESVQQVDRRLKNGNRGCRREADVREL